jgi:YjbE family integral membrane protein
MGGMISDDSGALLVLGQIVWLNAALSIDNAILIGLAARSLSGERRMLAMGYMAGAAVVVRVALTFFATYLLKLPYFQLIGGLILLWVGFQLMCAEGGAGEGAAQEGGSLMMAVRTVLVADLITSLDNVFAVAAAAKGDFTLLVIGLLISVPLAVFGGTLIIKVTDRYPVIVTFGAALIGWVAGDAISHDVARIGDTTPKAFFEANTLLSYVVKIGCAVLVVAVGKWLATRGKKHA